MQDLEHELGHFKKLVNVLESVSAALQTNELSQHVVKEIKELFQADEGSLVLFDPAANDNIKTFIREGQADAKLDHFLHEMLKGRIFEEKKPIFATDLSLLLNEHSMKPKYKEISALISIPLVAKEELLGMLCLTRATPKPPFSKFESELMTALVDLVASFIQSMNLHQRVFDENIRLKNELQERFDFNGIIGRSAQIRKVFALLKQIIPTEARVIISGESGTGKELIARAIHYNGPRQSKPFFAIDCGAMPANLIESELFGYVRGAFTGATRDRKGLFEEAHGGTLFLDEIANMPLEVQPKLLRAIQEGEIRPVGSSQIKKVDVRIIAAASGDLQRHVEEGTFRQDLFYRLNVVNIALPPLRERKEDIALLANHFLEKKNKDHHKQVRGFKSETMTCLESYHWPGNIRQLENVIERMVVLAGDDVEYIPPSLLPPEITERAPEPEASDIEGQVANLEKRRLLESLEKNNYNKSAAARELGKSEHYVRNKMKKLGIETPG
jgi:transcriptional regulator with GAF, ATPase, and Fis domain